MLGTVLGIRYPKMDAIESLMSSWSRFRRKEREKQRVEFGGKRVKCLTEE